MRRRFATAGRDVRIGRLCRPALTYRRESGRVITTVLGAGLAAALLIVSAVSLPVSGCSSPGGEPPSHTGYVLTTRSLLRTDLDSSRITRSRALPSSGRKIVRTGRDVAIQQSQAIQILDADTLTEQQSVPLSEGINDIAAFGPLLYAASGRRVYVMCVLPGGVVEPLTTITLPIRSPKHIDFLTARGRLVYALDDVVVPLFAYLIDLTGPISPRVSSAYWKGFNAIDTDFVAQAVADRWYVMVNSADRGLYVAALPVHPPLGEWSEHVVLIYNKVGPWGRILTASFAHEFQVHDGMLYGLEWSSHLSLYQTPVNVNQAAITEVADLGRVSLEQRRGVIAVEGSRLYVAGDTMLYGFELSGGSRPSRVLRMNAGAPIVSVAIGRETP